MYCIQTAINNYLKAKAKAKLLLFPSWALAIDPFARSPPEDGNIHPMASSSSAAASLMTSHMTPGMEEGINSSFAFAFALNRI